MGSEQRSEPKRNPLLCTSRLCPPGENVKCSNLQPRRGGVRGEGPSPPHLSWGRAPGCRIGTSLSLPRSTCPRWQGWDCCTVSGPAARPHRRCASRRHRAPIWPRSRPPMRKSPSCSCRGWDAHPHPDPAEELHRYATIPSHCKEIHHVSQEENDKQMVSVHSTHATLELGN